MIVENKNKIREKLIIYSKNQTGITLVSLVITIVIMIILVGVTVKFVIDDRIINKTEDYTQAVNNQIEEQESIANMVRNLYR